MTNPTDFIVAPSPIYALTVQGRAQRFPVNRIFCVGRNYAAHAREMGKDPERDPPFFFMKPACAIVDAATPVSLPYPPMTSNYQYEVELVVAIGKGGFEIPAGDVIMTGTPEGVGPVVAGDVMRGHIDKLSEITVTMFPQQTQAAGRR